MKDTSRSDTSAESVSDAAAWPSHTSVKFAFPVLLALLMLQIPFVRFYFEAYPMLILPRGDSVMRVDSTVRYRLYELRAEDAEGCLQAVPTGEVLSSLPEQYHAQIFGAHFGLRERAPRTSLRDAREARAWLRARVAEATGGDVSSARALHVRRIEIARPLRRSGDAGSEARADTTLLSSARVALEP